MAGQLKEGFQMKTEKGVTVRIEEYLAEGGQGEVYKVKYNDEEKALKWYKKTAIKDYESFYENLKHNVEKGAPSAEFLWPIDITEKVDGTFGYIMGLRPKGFYEITDYMLCHQRFPSYKVIVDAAQSIVNAFRNLHNAGYSYQDLNDGNFFINPQNGKVLICDNDNVAPDGMETGIMGKPRYMAPEIVMRKSKPNSLSDRFSMSVILYILFFLNHPLEGKRYLADALTPQKQEKLYGSEALFMMDPDDDSNGPHWMVHRNTTLVWKQTPDYMRNLFYKSFSQKALKNPTARAKEIDWINNLARFRSDIIDCECGNSVFTVGGRKKECDICKKMIEVPCRLKLGDKYDLPAVKDTRIYRCQLGVCNIEDALNLIAMVVEKKEQPGVYGIKNKSENSWEAITSKGEKKTVNPGDVVPVKPGIKLMMEQETIEIIANA